MDSNYRQKYFKYKTKYLQLKQQLGGSMTKSYKLDSKNPVDFNEINEKCDEQIRKDPFNNCTYCHYGHFGIENKSVVDANKDVKNLYQIQHPGKAFSVCSGHGAIKKYFEVEPGLKLEQYNDVSNTFFEIPYIQDNILNADLFYGLKSYKVNCSQDYDIEMYPKKIHTICAEGNIVWVNKESKVGSTGVDSCMFAVIILDDESKICIHHNVIDSFDFPGSVTNDNIYIKRNSTDVTFNLNEILNRAKLSSSNIKRIYLITRDEDSYDGTDNYGLGGIRNIIKTYNDISSDKIIKIIDSKVKGYDIIVNDDNNILNIKKK